MERKAHYVTSDCPTPEFDPVNKPYHYHKNGLDPLTVMKHNFTKEQLLGFYLGNILKYVLRHQEKGEGEDLKKAEFYIIEAIQLVGE